MAIEMETPAPIGIVGGISGQDIGVLWRTTLKERFET